MNKTIKKIASEPLRQGLIFISLLTVSSALIYRLYALNWPGIILSLAVTVIIYVFSFRLFNYNEILPNNSEEKLKKVHLFVIIAYIAIWIGLWYLLFSVRSDRALISPWELILGLFFFGYIALSLLLTWIIAKRLQIGQILLSAHLFLTLGVAAAVYKLGYGFDPFIHEAALRYIDQHGAVEPKTFYYLGEYGLFSIIHKFLAISFTNLNAWFLPLLAAITLPWSAGRFLDRLFPEKASRLSLLLIFIWPLSLFIFSTPQGLAYLFLLLSVFEALPLSKDNHQRWNLSLLFSITACAIHPLAGLPALAFVAISSPWVTNIRSSWKRSACQSIIAILGASAISIALMIGSHAKFSITMLGEAVRSLWQLPVWTSQESPLLNVLYLFVFNRGWILLVLLVVGIIISSRQKNLNNLRPALISAAMSALAWLGSAGLRSDALIDYEQNDYAQRLLTMAILFLLPFALIVGQKIASTAKAATKPAKAFLMVLLCLAMAASLYSDYPRRDRFFNSHGLSTSKADIETVSAIEKLAKDDYIVLANQQVSAAALKVFGFGRYYKDAQGQELFFYPIPTSSPLYQYYLSMVDKTPAKETMAKAMDLVGVKEGYLVVNKYWWAFPKIVAAGKAEADSWQALDGGSTYIFRYER